MDNEKNYKLKRNAALISLFVGIGMFFAKITAYLMTGSSAIFSDAAESVVHVIATSMALYSIIYSSKPADKSHLYGHGKIEYFSAGIEGLLIVIAALTIFYYSGKDILTGYKPSQLDYGTFIVGIAGAVNLFLGFFLIRKGKTTNSITLIADGKHVLTDSFTSIGVVIGLLLVLFTDFYLLDPLIAIAVAINILFTGYQLMRESIGGLMNETDRETLNTIVDELRNMKEDYWIDIHNLKFWKSSDRIFIDMHLSLPYFFTIKQSHLEAEKITNTLNKTFPYCQVNVHMDFCTETICRFCDYKECKVRAEEKSDQFDWVTEKLIGGPLKIIRHKDWDYPTAPEYKNN